MKQLEAIKGGECQTAETFQLNISGAAGDFSTMDSEYTHHSEGELWGPSGSLRAPQKAPTYCGVSKLPVGSKNVVLFIHIYVYLTAG